MSLIILNYIFLYQFFKYYTLLILMYLMVSTSSHPASNFMTSKQAPSPPWNSRRLAHSKEMVWTSVFRIKKSAGIMFDNVGNFKFSFYHILYYNPQVRVLKFRDWFGVSFFWCARFCDVKINRTQNHQIPI